MRGYGFWGSTVYILSKLKGMLIVRDGECNVSGRSCESIITVGNGDQTIIQSVTVPVHLPTRNFHRGTKITHREIIQGWCHSNNCQWLTRRSCSSHSMALRLFPKLWPCSYLGTYSSSFYFAGMHGNSHWQERSWKSWLLLPQAATQGGVSIHPFD